MSELHYALDTFYFLLSGVLVMWMAAGFTMLEAGMVRTKNASEIVMKNFALYGVACIMFLFIGYNIMYGTPGDLFVGGDHKAATADNYYSKLSDFFFQLVFVATAMSIVSGAVAERMKLWAFLVIAVVVTGVIYPIQGSWSWGGGWLSDFGFSDFAGSGIVHMFGGATALAVVLQLGPRKGKYSKDGKPQPIMGSNLVLVGLGTWILWMGWFGFNGGSQLKLSTLADANAVAQIFVNTNLAAAGGLLATMIVAKVLTGKTDLTLALNGALAGLVAITADPLSGSAMVSTIIGAIGGVIVYFSIIGLDKLKIDDAVGAISVHGVVGIWGVLAVPLTNADATILAQLAGIGAIAGFTFVTTSVFVFIVKKTMGIRVSVKEEHEGSDIEELGVTTYPEFKMSAKF
jgi:ammonium transporter, Amt family